jgi:hypothetical protein
MEEYMQRVLNEQFELNAKIVKLADFIENNQQYHMLQKEEQDDMVEQLKVMREYTKILERRILRFQKNRRV